MKTGALSPEFVDFIPEQLRDGILYVSRRYRTASHLCCCGCKREVVTPLNPAKWKLTEHPDGSVSLSPSVGNWGFPCRSHYWVSKNRVHWAADFSDDQIAAVVQRDRLAVDQLAKANQPAEHWVIAIWKSMTRPIKHWLGIK